MTNQLSNTKFHKQIVELLKVARKQIVQTVNQTMVLTYFEIGRQIVEEEQEGKERAEYGKQLLKGLLEALTKEFGRGFSLRNLEQIRKFYQIYSKSQTVSAESQNKSQTLSAKFQLSWSHYVKLIRIDNANERKFYEIEAQKNNWSVRELRRQYDSALYSRLALSRDKEKTKELSVEGMIKHTLIKRTPTKSKILK